MESNKSIVSRKKEHVDLCVESDVSFRAKTSGFERIEIEYNALPELDLDEVHTSTTFCSHELQMPLIVSGMTGGYAEAESINASLAEMCSSLGLAMGVGSQKQSLRSTDFHRSFQTVREHAPQSCLIANMGAADLVHEDAIDDVRRVIELIDANVLALHLNPLQELLQPEGNPRFRGVARVIETLCRDLEIPVMVKEVGAGLSASVIERLLGLGVDVIDVAGAGGTSWAGVELLRAGENELSELWDYGIPTVDCLRAARPLKAQHEFTLVASGGISNGFECAKAIAHGADVCASARPILRCLREHGEVALSDMLNQWKRQLRSSMFLAGVATLAELQQCKVISH